MTFSEYALGLSPFISSGISEPNYFDELIGNFIQDAAMDSCKMLERKSDTKYRYITGKRVIQPKDAQYLYDCRDLNKFSAWILERMDESESFDNVGAWLKNHGIESDHPPDACATLLENIILNIISGTSVPRATQELAVDLKLIDDIQEKIKSLPRPANVPVPKVATQDEQVYISELLLAYGDATGLTAFSEKNFSSYPEYSEDLDDRRIDFYAAETIRRGVLELRSSSLTDQFEVLKKETLDGVKDTAKRTHPSGYDRMLAVMEQAVIVPVTNYILSASPYWISATIKKGVCHHLVNDRKLVWVRRRKNL